MKSVDVTSVGGRIRQARQQAGLSQIELGEKIGVTGVAVGNMELGKRHPKIGTLNKIACALGVNVSFFVPELYSHGESLTLNEYQTLAARTVGSLDRMGMECHALHGMVGEIGEVHSLYQKEYQGHIMDEKHLMKEVGDLLWFIAELCTAKGWALAEVAQMNIDKLRERYPNGFESEKSLHRREGDI